MPRFNRGWGIPLALLIAAAPLAAADVKVNAEYDGKLPATKSTLPVKGGNTYVETLTVDLESGREVTVSARGEGDRIIALAVFDKGNNLIGRSFNTRFTPKGGLTMQQLTPQQVVATQFAVATGGKSTEKIDPAKSGTLTFKVPANGQYTVMVMSNLSGEYKLTVSDPKAKATSASRTADTIRKELQAAEKRVEELKKELKEKTEGTVGK